MTAGVTIREIERELGRLRDSSTDADEAPRLRTSVMTHIAWVPERWVEAVHGVMSELGERHPSRVILLFPRPDEPRDELDADVDLRCFMRQGEHKVVCSEVVALALCGARAHAPASIVQPLLVSDLPVFLRWRGELTLGSPELEQLVALADRLVVDSREWADPAATASQLAGRLDDVAVSDIAWTRTQPWREGIASLWPDIADARRARIAGPKAEALLLCRWLSSRLGRQVELQLEPAGEIELVEVDGRAALARAEPKSPADLLSDQLEIFGHDRIYEETVRSFSSAPT